MIKKGMNDPIISLQKYVFLYFFSKGLKFWMTLSFLYKNMSFFISSLKGWNSVNVKDRDRETKDADTDWRRIDI